jgi:isopentenyl diphosphate isomerase/L-lactate dehydrogenase-like FMN-dependent dehydrogenase
MSGTSLIPMETVQAAAPDTWFQAYLPGDAKRRDALIERIDAAGFATLVLTVDIPVWANRENNVRTGFSLPLRPSVRLAFDGASRPRWLAGTFARTLLSHGCRISKIPSRLVATDPVRLGNSRYHGRDHLSWADIERIRQGGAATWSSRAFCIRPTPSALLRWARTASSSRITAGANWTVRWNRLPYCRASVKASRTRQPS